MKKLDPAELAAQVAARLNRPARDDNPAHFFEVQEESFEIVSSDEISQGGRKVCFQFQGLVTNKDEPVTYLASGSVTVQPDGTIRPETIEF